MMSINHLLMLRSVDDFVHGVWRVELLDLVLVEYLVVLHTFIRLKQHGQVNFSQNLSTARLMVITNMFVSCSE